MDLVRFELRRHGLKQETTPTELKLLAAFVRNKERVLTRDKPLEDVWGSGVYVTDRVVDNHSVALRKKIEDDPSGAALPHQYPRRGISDRRGEGECVRKS